MKIQIKNKIYSLSKSQKKVVLALLHGNAYVRRSESYHYQHVIENGEQKIDFRLSTLKSLEDREILITSGSDNILILNPEHKLICQN